MVKKVLAKVEQHKEEHGEEVVLYGADRASLIQLIQISGYLKVFVKKLKRGESIQEDSLNSLLKLKKTLNKLLKKFPLKDVNSKTRS